MNIVSAGGTFGHYRERATRHPRGLEEEGSHLHGYFFQPQTTNTSELRPSGNMDLGILGTGGKGKLCRGRDCGFEATGRENGEEHVGTSVSLSVRGSLAVGITEVRLLRLYSLIFV